MKIPTEINFKGEHALTLGQAIPNGGTSTNEEGLINMYVRIYLHSTLICHIYKSQLYYYQ